MSIGFHKFFIKFDQLWAEWRLKVGQIPFHRLTSGALHLCAPTHPRQPRIEKFLRVPKDAKRRKLWLKAVKREEKSLSDSTVAFCCEDHFTVS